MMPETSSLQRPCASGTTLLEGARIVFLFGSFDLGGAERQGLLLADYFQSRLKAHVKICALNTKPGLLSECCDELGIPWQGIPFHWGLSRRWYYFPKALAALKAEKPDILVSYTCVPNLVCALCRQATGAKLSVWNQADEGLLMNQLPLHRWAVRQSRCIISNSSGGKRFLANAYGIPEHDIHLILNGIRLPEPRKNRELWRKELGIFPGDVVACMVANLSPYKDHETLVRAWHDVITDIPGNVRPMLLLAGRFDGMEQRIRELLSELKIADSIKLLGPVTDISGLLNAADVFVYSSKSEGIPNAVLEAMAAGLPVTGTDIPGVREAVGIEGSSFLTPVGDHVGMADKIKLLVAEPELRASYGSTLQKRVKTEFSIDRMCTASAQVITDALAAVMNPQNQGLS